MNVLILTDFLETSGNAGRYAVDFLQKEQVNFYLLNIKNFNFNKSAESKLGNEVVTTLEALQKSAKELKAYTRNKKHKFNTILSSENLISAVRKALSEKKIDLIFIGAVSHAEHDHPILGSHAYDVVRKIKCNIIAVPGSCSFVDPKKAVFPVDPEILSVNAQDGVVHDLNYLEPLDFTYLEIKDGDIDYHDSSNPNGTIKTPVPFTRELFRELQEEFDIIFVVGRNLSICDRLLHAKYGFSAHMDIKIPIFVYHG